MPTNDELSTDQRVFTVLASLTDQEILNQQIVYRKLAGQGLVHAAVVILRMDRVDYESFLTTCGDDIDEDVS